MLRNTCTCTSNLSVNPLLCSSIDNAKVADFMVIVLIFSGLGEDLIIFITVLQILSFKLNVGQFPHLADLVTRINYNYFYMSDSGSLITTSG